MVTDGEQIFNSKEILQSLRNFLKLKNHAYLILIQEDDRLYSQQTIIINDG